MRETSTQHLRPTAPPLLHQPRVPGLQPEEKSRDRSVHFLSWTGSLSALTRHHFPTALCQAEKKTELETFSSLPRPTARVLLALAAMCQWLPHPCFCSSSGHSVPAASQGPTGTSHSAGPKRLPSVYTCTFFPHFNISEIRAYLYICGMQYGFLLQWYFLKMVHLIMHGIWELMKSDHSLTTTPLPFTAPPPGFLTLVSSRT